MKKSLLFALALCLALAMALPTVGAAEATADGGEIYLMRGTGYDTPMLQSVLDLIEADTGVKINIVWNEGNSGADMFVLMVSSGERVDATVTTAATFTQYLNSGMLYPLSALIDENGANITARVREDLWSWVKGDDGEVYGIPSEQVPCVTMVSVRKDWLDELGLGEPTTVQEYEDMLYAMKDKYNCAPLLMQLQRTGRHYDAFLGGAMLPMGYSWWESEDGSFLPPEMHPEYVEIIELMRKWYSDGLMSPDSIALRANGKALVEANLVGAIMDSWSLPQLYSRDAVNVIEGIEWTIQPALTGKYSLGNYAAMGASAMLVVNVNAQNPAGVVKVVDWIAESLEHTIISRQGVRGVNWEYTDPDGEKPVNFTDATNTVEMLAVDDAHKYAGGAMELLDINNFVERRANPDIYMASANAWWDLNYSDSFTKYLTLDDQYQVVESALPCLTEINDCKKALEEKIIAIVTGSDDISTWESWVNGEYQNIGMKTIIEVRTELFKEKMGK